jgi:hypothetical protein
LWIIGRRLAGLTSRSLAYGSTKKEKKEEETA